MGSSSGLETVFSLSFLGRKHWTEKFQLRNQENVKRNTAAKRNARKKAGQQKLKNKAWKRLKSRQRRRTNGRRIKPIDKLISQATTADHNPSLHFKFQQEKKNGSKFQNIFINKNKTCKIKKNSILMIIFYSDLSNLAGHLWCLDLIIFMIPFDFHFHIFESFDNEIIFHRITS